jgi:hypothetical protein
MRIQDVYRLALANGMTAKEAGAFYKVNHQSLAKCKTRYDLPSLVSEYEKADRESLARMSDKELESYIKVLESKDYSQSTEHRYATEERTLRAKRNKKVLR